MAESLQLLDELDLRIQSATEQTDTRAEALTDLMLRTREYWQTWNDQWRTVVELLENRCQELARQDGQAGDIVAIAESKLAETETALRTWLAAARKLAESVKR